eukprot:c32580_g1_i1.p1 GENE.c32580_g1_i1~~c32580_g1_i1.p1  ORF type:complete len:199 (-),score=30.17 c32580_g1_i1:62-625(-)
MWGWLSVVLLLATLCSAERLTNPVQSIICDVCLKKVTNCNAYVPDKSMFSFTRPDPQQNMGTLWECPPSEWELWSTDGAFTVGDAVHPPEVSAPCVQRRMPKSTGLLGRGRRACELAISKAPKSRTIATCSALMNDVAPNPQGRTVDCSMRFVATQKANVWDQLTGFVRQKLLEADQEEEELEDSVE